MCLKELCPYTPLTIFGARLRMCTIGKGLAVEVAEEMVDWCLQGACLLLWGQMLVEVLGFRLLLMVL